MQTLNARPRSGRPGERRRLAPTLAVLGTALTLALCSLGLTGCKDTACLQWSADRGECPARQEALKRFGGQSCVADIKSVDSDAEPDAEACCYEVTKREFGDFSCPDLGQPDPTSVGAGPGPDSPPVACGGCAAFEAGEVGNLCEASMGTWSALASCVCSGACAAACDDGSCATSFDTPECQACVADTTNGCGNEMNACSKDL